MKRTILFVFAILIMAGCSAIRFVDAPSRNQSSRIQFVVVHFTTENFDDSLALLTKPSANPVSSHYLIPEPGDETYDRKQLAVYRLVDEERRAWHAGRSSWVGTEGLNDRSIGIELVNRSYCTQPIDSGPPDAAPELECVYPSFPPQQIELLITLLTDILSRYPDIEPLDIVGHADIAPGRKVDPGPAFPWQTLYEAGIGAWYDDITVQTYRQRFAGNLPSLEIVQDALRTIGYAVETTGVNDRQTQEGLRAFQMRFRPAAVTAAIDTESAAILFALLEKYRPESMSTLLAELQPRP